MNYSNIIKLCILVLFIPLPGYAQDASIQGTVTDVETGDPLPGANVVIQGTALGAATNEDGRYALSIPEAQVTGEQVTLSVTFVGYRTLRRTITLTPGEHNEDFALTADVVGFEDVVVTAIGITREERSLGYAVQRVSGEDLQRASTGNLADALRGQAAGMNIVSSSGQPGAASRIEIRGVSSITGDNQPLWVIDGVIISADEDATAGYESTLFTGGGASRQVDIDPSIIEDVTVLRGASATALYGSRAANGAIIVTTRGAMEHRPATPDIRFRTRVGFENAIVEGHQNEYLLGMDGFYINGLPMDRGGFIDPREFRVTEAGDTVFNPLTNPQTIRNWGPHKDDVPQEVLDALGVDRIETFDPRGDFYRRASTIENAVSVSGGVEGFNYYFNFSNMNQGGIVPNTSLDRSSVHGRFGGRITPRLSVNTSFNYTQTDNIWMGQGNGARAVLWSLLPAPINFDLSDYQWEDGSQRMYHASLGNNPHWLVRNNRYTSSVDRTIGSLEINYNILPWLQLREQLSLDRYSDTRKEEINLGTIGRPDGSMFDRTNKRMEFNSDLQLFAQFALSDDVRLDAIIGHNINMREWKWERQRGIGLGGPDFFHISNAVTIVGDDWLEEQRQIGVYSQLVLDYREMFYLNLTARNDWSSTLPTDDNSYFYPSASVGLVFTEMFPNVFRNSFMNYGRLRLAVSQVGRDADPYQLVTSLIRTNPEDGVRGEITYPFRGHGAYTVSNTHGNPELSPELTTEYEVGFDLRFFNGRARVDVSYYDRTTVDQIFSVPMSLGTGFSTMPRNAGEIRNYGVELTLGGTPIQSRNFTWDLRANFSQNTNEVVELAPGVESIPLGGFTSNQVRIMEGKGNYGVLWSRGFARDEHGNKLIDDNGFPIPSDGLKEIGNVMPDWTANLRSTMRYRGFEVSALLDIRQGGDIMNLDQFYTIIYGTHIETANRGTMYTYDGVNVNTGEPNDVAILRDYDYYAGIYRIIEEHFVEDGSYVKLREVSVAYSLPSSIVNLLPVSGATLSFTGTNLWISSDFSYLDPEGNLLGSGNAQGFYHMVIPSTRGYNFSLSLNI